MAENLIDIEIPEKKSVKKNSFYVVDESVDAKRIEDVNNLLNDALKTEKKQVEQKPQKVEEKFVKQENIIDNPFFGDKNSLSKLKKHPDYEIVEEEETFEKTIIHKKNQVSSQSITRKETSNKQRKLWMVAGGIVLALFIGLFGYNMFSINSIAKRVVTTQHDITQMEQTLEQNNSDYEQLLENAKLTSEMHEVDIDGETTIDLSPKNTKNQYEVKTSLWDKMCNFFAKIYF